MVEAKKLKFLVDHLSESATDFEKCIARIDDAHWSLRPTPDRWSIAEIAEHVMTVDASIARMLGTLGKWPQEEYEVEKWNRKDEVVLRLAVQRETKMEAPVQMRPSGTLTSPADFYPAFRQTHDSLNRVATEHPELLRGRFREHPFLKKLDGYQWLLVCSCHRRRHMDQIEEVRKLVTT